MTGWGARDLRAVGIEVDSKKGSQIDCKPVFVEHRRFELLTSCMPCKRSTS